jgi:hypothetical protein
LLSGHIEESEGMTKPWRVLFRVVAGIVIVCFLAMALAVWSLLPPVMPQRGQKLSALVREALWLREDKVATYHLARVHLSSTFLRERHLKRQLRELALANWLSLWWSRDDIVDAYGAVVYMGSSRSGLEAGARHVFGQPISELSTARLAMLVTMIRSPNRYDPACHPECALEARNAFIVRMREALLLTESEAKSAIAEPLGAISACEERKDN